MSDGSLILVHSRGMRNGLAEVLARLAAGEAVDPGQYRFHTIVTYETGAPAHAWVNRRLFIAVAARPDAVLIDLYESRVTHSSAFARPRRCASAALGRGDAAAQ